MLEANGRYEVRTGDLFKVLQDVPNQSIDFIFADPPYFLSNNGTSVKSGKRVSVNKGDWDKSAGSTFDRLFHKSWLELCINKLSPPGSLVVSSTAHSTYKIGTAIEDLGLKVLNEIVWYKPNAAPNLGRRHLTASHETLIWATRQDNKQYTFNYNELKDGHFPEDKLKNENKQMRSVWSIPTTPGREKRLGGHPTQKPLALLERVIIALTAVDDIVLDPFCGSGTTGVAALRLGRRFVGIDIVSEYTEVAARRLEELID